MFGHLATLDCIGIEAPAHGIVATHAPASASHLGDGRSRVMNRGRAIRTGA